MFLFTFLKWIYRINLFLELGYKCNVMTGFARVFEEVPELAFMLEIFNLKSSWAHFCKDVWFPEAQKSFRNTGPIKSENFAYFQPKLYFHSAWISDWEGIAFNWGETY